MICPYCSKEIKDNLEYCPECGQVLHASSRTIKKVETYWEDVSHSNKNRLDKKSEKEKAAKKEAREKKNTILKKGMLLAILLLVLIGSYIGISIHNAKMIEQVKANTIGQTFSEMKGSSVIDDGEKRFRKEVEILDDHILHCTSGVYIFHWGRDENGKYQSSWEISEVNEEGDYDYELRMSLYGDASIIFNGESYEVSIDKENYQISHVALIKTSSSRQTKNMIITGLLVLVLLFAIAQIMKERVTQGKVSNVTSGVHVWCSDGQMRIVYKIKPPHFRNIPGNDMFAEFSSCGYCKYYDQDRGCSKYGVRGEGVGSAVKTVCDDFQTGL